MTPRLIRHPADRVPVALFFSLFALDLAVFFLCGSIWLTSLWALIGLAPKACICSWNHHHQHVAMFRSHFWNRVLEVVFSFQTGITTNAWVLHHVLGHHLNYLDQTKDESGWMRADGKTMGTFEYVWNLAWSGYIRAWQVGKNHKKYQRSMLRAGTFVIILLSGFIYWNWVNALILFVIPMLLGYIFTCWHTYYHHAGLHTDSHHDASYNIMDSFYNWATGNLGYHTAHHMKPGLHWSKLPEYHQSIAKHIPSHLFVEPCVPFCWIARVFRPGLRAARHPATLVHRASPR